MCYAHVLVQLGSSQRSIVANSKHTELNKEYITFVKTTSAGHWFVNYYNKITTYKNIKKPPVPLIFVCSRKKNLKGKLCFVCPKHKYIIHTITLFTHKKKKCYIYLPS